MKAISANLTARDAAYRKLHITALVMKTVLLGYILFGFFRFVPWWFAKQGIENWQRALGLSLNFISWGCLVAAVVYVWKFFDLFHTTKTLTERGGIYFMYCAWFAIASQAMNVLARPINSWIVTAHLDTSMQQFNWSFTYRDPLAAVFCLSLLMFAYIHRWFLDIAQENAEFV